MKAIYWLILLQYFILNTNSQLISHGKSEPTTTTAPTEAAETSSELPKQYHPNFMSPHGALEYGPFGTHPMSRPSGQSNMMFQLPHMFNPADPDMFSMVPPPVAAEMMSQQLPPNSQMYQGQPPDQQMFPGQPPSSQMFPGPPPDQQIFPGPPGPEMYSGEPSNMMQMIDPRAFGPSIDHPAILPVMAPDSNPMIPEPGDYPGIMDYMNNENPFDMPPPFLNRHPAPQFPVLPPFLEGLPAPSENGQRVPGKKWRYKNSGHLKWPSKYSYCSGNRQSPIDIDDRNIIYTPNLKHFSFTGFDGLNTAFSVKNNGHTASIRVSGNMSVSGGGFGDVYNTAEIHFHWGSNDRDGSEHAVNGRKYPLEMHIVNYATKYGDLKNAMQYKDGLGVLGVLFDIGQENPAFTHIERQLKKVQNPGTSAPLPTINVRQLLPVNAGNYFRYYGSLTTPPCYQSVLWTIFEKRQTISPNQLESLRSLYETTKNVPEAPNAVTFGEAMIDNFRPLQPMLGRIINTNIKRYANPIYLAHPGMEIIPVVQQAAPVIQATSQPRELIPQFHPNKSAAKSTAIATIKQGVNQITSLPLPPLQAALNIAEPRVTTIPTISSFRTTKGSVITVVDVPGNVSKPAELIVVNTSRLVEQLSHPAVQPQPVIPAPQKLPKIAAPQITTHLKQLHPVITAAKTTPAITTATSVTPTLLPITTSSKAPTSTTSQTTTILLPTSPTSAPTTSTKSPATSTSSSTAKSINSKLKAVVQNFPMLSNQNSIQSGSNQGTNQLLPELVPVQPLELIPEPLIPTGTQQSSANAAQPLNNANPSLDPIIASQVPSAAEQRPVFNPVDLSTQIVSDPILQSTAAQSSNPAQVSQRIVQEARKAAIEAAQQQLALGSQQSPDFTKLVIEAATKAAQAQIAQLMTQSTSTSVTPQLTPAEQNVPLSSPVEPLGAQTVKSHIGHIDPSQAQQAVTQTGQQQQPRLEQQAKTGGAQQVASQPTEQQLLEQRFVQQLAEQQLLKHQAAQTSTKQAPFQVTDPPNVQAAQQPVDRPQLLDQQAVNKAAQQQIIQQLRSEPQAASTVVQQAAFQPTEQQKLQTAQQLVDLPQLLDPQAIKQAIQQRLIKQLLLEQQATKQTSKTQQSLEQKAIQQVAQKLAEQQQLLLQQAKKQAAQQKLLDQQQQLIQQQLSAIPVAQAQLGGQATQKAVQQPITQQAPNQQQPSPPLTNLALQQLLAQKLASQQAANQAAQQQAANQAAQQQATKLLANQATQQQAAQQAANQDARQQSVQLVANQAAQQQTAQQAANQAAQQQISKPITQQQPTQAELIQLVLAEMRTQANFDKLTKQQMVKLVSNRVRQKQNELRVASNTLVSQQKPQQTTQVSGTTTNLQGTSAKTRNLLIQPSAQGSPVVSVLRKAPLQSERAQTVHWAALQRARSNTQAKAQTQANSQALTAAKTVSVLVPRQTSIVPTVRFASTSQKLHPVNVLPNQVRFQDPNTLKQETGLVASNIPPLQSYLRAPASSTGSQSSLIQAYFSALSKSKPEVVPVLRRVRTQFGDKKLLNYLQKKFGRLRTV